MHSIPFPRSIIISIVVPRKARDNFFVKSTGKTASLSVSAWALQLSRQSDFDGTLAPRALKANAAVWRNNGYTPSRIVSGEGTAFRRRFLSSTEGSTRG